MRLSPDSPGSSAAGAGGATPPPRGLVVGAFAAVYAIWGSTYLAIAVGLESLPPFFMMGLRFLVAGGVLLGLALLRGERWPAWESWLAAAGQAILLFGAYGLLAWGEGRVSSGVAAVLAATSPLFVLLLDRGARGRAAARVGMALGLAGVVVLVVPGSSTGGLDPAGTAALLGSALLWGLGSVRPPRKTAGVSPLMVAAMELLGGSVLLSTVGALVGEAAALHGHAVSGRSMAAVAYLAVFGSVVAYTAFRWLLGVASPSLVSTHAYVNPVVALALGGAIHGEAVTRSTVAGAALVLTGVVAVAVAARTPGPVAVAAGGPHPSRKRTASASACSV